MVEQDYVDLCNLAYDLRQRAQAFFEPYGDELVYQLDSLVRMELSACPSGSVEPAHDFLAAILAEEVAEREKPKSNVVQMPRSSTDGIPF